MLASIHVYGYFSNLLLAFPNMMTRVSVKRVLLIDHNASPQRESTTQVREGGIHIHSFVSIKDKECMYGRHVLHNYSTQEYTTLPIHPIRSITVQIRRGVCACNVPSAHTVACGSATLPSAGTGSSRTRNLRSRAPPPPPPPQHHTPCRVPSSTA